MKLEEDYPFSFCRINLKFSDLKIIDNIIDLTDYQIDLIRYIRCYNGFVYFAVKFIFNSISKKLTILNDLNINATETLRKANGVYYLQIDCESKVHARNIKLEKLGI